MTTVVILQYGEPWISLASTTLIKAIHRDHNKVSLDWATTQESYCLFQHNSRIRDLMVGYGPFYNRYDIAINLSPTEESCSIMGDIEAKSKMGFGIVNGKIGYFNADAEEGLSVLKKNETSERNILQILFRIAGLRWRGDGYDLAYYPKNKTKKIKTGIAIENEELRKYVKNNLNLQQSELWHVPMKQNLLKRIDEINRCKRIVTDDLFSVHASIAMRKHVEFLDTKGLNINMEFFGNGNHIRLKNEHKNI